jgi:hypothetical protein
MTDRPVRLGYLQQQMFDFLVKSGRLHSVAHDYKTVKVAKSLERRGLIKLVDCGMCTATGRTVYMARALSSTTQGAK